MSQKAFSIPITDVVDLLGLEIDPKGRNGTSFNVKCPFCANARTRKYHMNINTQKNVYFCPKCMDASPAGSGALDLYGRVRLGTPLIPGRNGAELYHKLATELEGEHCYTRKPAVQPVLPEEIYPASNEILNKAYSILLSRPYFTLNRKHGKNLIKRGLDRDSIASGMYASFPPVERLASEIPFFEEASAWYDKAHCETYRKTSPILKYYSKESIIVGLCIAKDVRNMGADLTNVPGFFKIKGSWCFRYDQGMAIPTVAIDGNIVGIQVRRDVATAAGLRYMTLSSKGLDCGVTTGIARTHVARDCEIADDTSVFITEGPLKANVILHLLRERGTKNIAVVAIQGVNNTKELPAIAKKLCESGVKRVYSAFDMDKTGNLSVARAAGTIKKILSDSGLEVTSICWDKEYGVKKYSELSELCCKHKLVIPKSTGDVFEDIYKLAVLLNQNNVEYNTKLVNGKVYKDHWDDSSKGLDDYLNKIREGAV